MTPAFSPDATASLLRDWRFPETAGQEERPALAPPSGATTH